jgi:hypothetical protein
MSGNFIKEDVVTTRLARIALVLAVVALAIPWPLHAQGLTGQISGVVTDATGAVLPGVTVTVKNVGTGLTRETVTGPDGAFLIPDLLSGTFDLTARMEGFKTFEQKGIELGATERVRVRTITLAIGGIEELVTVQTERTLVQTTNGARSALITRDTMEDIALKGRDSAGFLKLLPGVIDTRNREAPGWESMLNLSINGRTSFNYTYDGITNKDTGQNAGNFSAPSIDSIAEIRVQASNFQAEYGRSSGATISLVTRSGSKDFRGSAGFYKRDDALNANEYSRRILCNQGQTAQCDPPLYKFDNFAWTLGGPVLIPGTEFNRSRNKLFFFWSQEILSRTDPGNLNQRRVPTALEREGDFSQTRDGQGRLIFIRDPRLSGNCAAITGGPACFPSNMIPADRIDRNAQALMKLFPMPNAVDPSGTNQFNYVYQTEQDWPRDDQVLRVDWNAARNTTVYGRLQYGYEKRSGGVSILGSTGGWPQMPTKYEIDTVGYVNTLLHTFSPSLFGEFTTGVNWSHQNTSPMDQAAADANDRRVVLPGMPQFFPQANPLHIIPQASFGGGVPGNPLSFGIEQRFPFFGYNTLFNVSGNLTKSTTAHTIKTGLFVEHTTRPAQRTSSFNGNFSFNTDTQNLNNTNIGYANALLGAITEYQESDGHPSAHGQFFIAEWYAQDTWRVKRNLTLDAGIRFYYMTPTRSDGDDIAQFEPAEWNGAQAPQLFQPVSTPQGRRALNPLTGVIFPTVYIGRLVPGSGNAINGVHVYEGTPQNTSPFRAAPRVSFAWDVTGDGKTAVRGGAGIYYDRYQDDNILDLIEMPPIINTYRTNYTTIGELLAQPLTATPSNLRRMSEFNPPVVYNWSAGVQREVGFNAVADVAYVGNAGRNQVVTVDLNGRPYGYAYLPSSLDSTVVVGGQPQPLPDDFLRPYQGWGRIQQREFSGYADYHALQLALNRRRAADGLSFGAAYTYQISNKSLGTIDPFIEDNRARNYTQNGRRPHVLVVNYSYSVPNLSTKWDNLLVKAIFDEWQFSGVTTFTSGTYGALGYNYSNVPTGTLTGTGAINGGASRPNIVCDPNLPRSERTFERQFRVECIAPPTDPHRLGTSTSDEYLGPGYMNWDISAFKSVPMGGTRRLQLRVELYNAFNTNQWTGVNTTANFDYTTGALTNAATVGRLTNTTLSARRIQLGARFSF